MIISRVTILAFYAELLNELRWCNLNGIFGNKFWNLLDFMSSYTVGWIHKDSCSKRLWLELYLRCGCEFRWCILIAGPYRLFTFTLLPPHLVVLMGSPSHGGDVTVYVKDINQPSLPTFYSVLVFICLYSPFNCISLNKFSRQFSIFSRCSSGLLSALLARSTYIPPYEGLLQPLYNPWWLTGLKTPIG